MRSCFLIKDSSANGGGGGGNGGGGGMIKAARLIVRRNAALGDSLCATVVADRLIDLGFEVNWQTHPAIHCLIKRHPRISQVSELTCKPDVDLDGAYEKDPNRKRKHFHVMFFEAAQRQLSQIGVNLGPPLNCYAKLRLPPTLKAAALAKFAEYPRPWVFICPRSDTYAVRQVPDGIWREAAPLIHGTKFWVGRHPAPPGFIDLQCRHFDNVITWLSAADLLISVDTGPLHVAAALGVPLLALGQSSSPELHLSDQVDFLTIEPKLNCLNCQLNICPINSDLPPCQSFEPAFIAAWANAKLRQRFTENVSAVVAIWQPEVATLNRCLEALLPQVDEIIVTAEANSRVPEGRLLHEKIRYVKTTKAGIGYGRNANYGARHATGKYLLLLNDDVFINPGAVEALKAEMKPGVGMAANLLRYPDGLIYHAGKRRSPGVRGWGHIDHRHRDPTIHQPMEMENVCMACVMVSREAFYAIHGFDEDFTLYAEDDDFSLRLRRAGYKIIYTPHSSGIHMEHQSTRKMGNIMDLVNTANATFDRKWRAYLDHNLNKIPGTFDY